MVTKAKKKTKKKTEEKPKSFYTEANKYGEVLSARESIKRKHIVIRPVSTGIFPLDYGTGINGLPRGMLVEFLGPESGGKTTLALSIIAESQRRSGKKSLFIDAEWSLEEEWLKTLGVDLDLLDVSKVDYNIGEKYFKILELAIASRKYEFIVLDSVAALCPKKVHEREVEDKDIPGVHALMMRTGLWKIMPALGKTNTCMIAINQIRKKVGVVFGNPETTTGGHALRHWKQMSFRISRKPKSVFEDPQTKEIAGHWINVRIDKSKISKPNKYNVEFPIDFTRGVDFGRLYLKMGKHFDIITTTRDEYDIDGVCSIEGKRESVHELLRNDRILRSHLDSRILEAIHNN